MNIFSLFGLLLSVIVLGAGLVMSSDKLGIFFDGPSLFIVLGGTFAAISISIQLNKAGMLFKVFLNSFIKGRNINFADVIKEIMSLTESYRTGKSLQDIISEAKDPFLKEGIQLMSDGILEKEVIMDILYQRAEQMNNLRTLDAKKFQSLGKYPPAFGMMGTTIGMVVLLSNLGGPDAMKMIGPAMGVCLITTLYGVIIANLALVPIADNILDQTQQIETKNELILEGFKHILNKSNPILVAEDLNSFLLPKDRLDWKSIKK